MFIGAGSGAVEGGITNCAMYNAHQSKINEKYYKLSTFITKLSKTNQNL